MGKVFITTDGKKIERVSRWIKIRQAYNVTEKHSLYYYAEKLEENENMLDYFIFNGRKYALNQFYRFGTMWTPSPPPMFYENDKLHYISGYDAENYYNPLLIEVEECGEAVRIYRDI